MKVTVRALLVGWRSELAAAAEYRADFVVGMFVSALWLVLAVIPAVIVYTHVDSAAGWTLERLLLVQAVWYALDGIMWMMLVPNLYGLSDQVRSGDLDFLLLQPGHALFRMSLTRLNVADIPKLVLAAGLAVVALLRGIDLTLGAAVRGLVGIAGAMVLMWSLGVLTHIKTITTVRFEAGFALHSAHNLARIPVTFYGLTVRWILTFIVPVAFLTTIPAELLFGARSWGTFFASLGVAAAAVTLTLGAWRHEIGRYTGATA